MWVQSEGMEETRPILIVVETLRIYTYKIESEGVPNLPTFQFQKY